MNRKYVKDDSFDSEEEEQQQKESAHEGEKDNHEASLSTNYSKNQSVSSSTQSYKLLTDTQTSLDFNFDSFSSFEQTHSQFHSQSQISQSQFQPLAQSQYISQSSKRISKPYDYQTAIFNQAKGQNSIIFMETGKGKTYIAIMLIADLLNIKLELVNITAQKTNKKKAIFLVCDSALVAQQIETIAINTLLKVSSLQGKKGKQSKSNYQEFRELFKLTDVFVAIPDVLYKLLSIGFLKISEVDMLIFDECHHTNSNHVYNILMNEFYFFYQIDPKASKMKLPLIVGLTASPLKTKIEKDIEITAKKAMVQLCENLDAKMIIDPEMRMNYDLSEESGFLFREDDTVTNNKEYIEIQSHLTNKLFKQIYGIIKKLFLLPFLEMAWNTLDTYTKASNIKDEYITFIDQKFFSNNFCEFNTATSQYKQLYGFRNQSSLFRVFEKIQRNLFMLFESLDLTSVIKFFELYQGIYIEKRKKFDLQMETNTNNNLNNINISNTSTSSNDLMLLTSLELSMNEYETNQMTQLLNALENTTKALKSIANDQKEYCFEADRLNKLIKTIDEILLSNPNSKIIIFVANRIVAHFLEQILNDHFDNYLNMKSSIPNARFKSISVIGINKRKTEDQSLFDPKNSLKVLNSKIQMFNSDKVNILIGTSTVEEGLDVQKCNVVIVFTELNTTKSYIQMKGRARKKNAKFLVFTDSKAKTMANINNFILLSKCMRKLFTEGISRDFKSDDYLKTKTLNKYNVYIKETEAKATLRNVIPIVTEIFHQLKNSMKIQIKKKTEEIKGSGSFGQNGFCCTMTLSGGWFGNGRDVKSNFHTDKQSAENECDLRLIKALLEKGKLDHHFKLIKQ